MRTVSGNSYLHAMGCQALWTGAECKRTIWEPCVRGAIQRRSIWCEGLFCLSRSLIKKNETNQRKQIDQIDQINQLDQIPATCREMLDCKTLFLPEILC